MGRSTDLKIIMRRKREITKEDVCLIRFLLFVIFGLTVYNTAVAKELPLEVEINELNAHDGERVAVKGWIRSEEYFRGRMGSDNLMHRFGQGDSEIFVYTGFPTYLLNKQARVIGVYHKEGWYAGKLVENFISAEWIVRED